MLKTEEASNQKMKRNFETSAQDLLDTHKPKAFALATEQTRIYYPAGRPDTYFKSRIIGLGYTPKECNNQAIKDLAHNSRSSVYSGNTYLRFREMKAVINGVRLSAAAKKANKLWTHIYSNLYYKTDKGGASLAICEHVGRYGIAAIAAHRGNAKAKHVRMFNHGKMKRDFTYIGDIVEGVIWVHKKPAEANPVFKKDQPDPASSCAEHRVFNIGNNDPIKFMKFISCLEQTLGVDAIMQFELIQPEDAEATAANTIALEGRVGSKPATQIGQGVEAFASWYRNYLQL